jgi:hypothetical protein
MKNPSLWSFVLKILFLAGIAFTVDTLSAQTPSIATFTPTSGPIGTNVTLTGTNFNSTPINNIVWFGAVQATVTAATSTSLSVTVPMGATYQPISVTISGNTAYSNAPFNITFPSTPIIDATAFATRVDFPTGITPNGTAIVDIDGDSKPDMVVINNGSNTISIYKNTSVSGSVSAGSFASRVDFPTGTLPDGLAVGDIDGDGKPDIVVSNSATSNTVSVFRNTCTPGIISAGSFAHMVEFPTGMNPGSLVIGDIDSDGKPDLIVANNYSNTISVLKNTSTPGSITAGSFAARVDFNTGVGPDGLAIGDIDGDSKPDLIVSNSGSNTVSVFRNTGISGSVTDRKSVV